MNENTGSPTDFDRMLEEATALTLPEGGPWLAEPRTEDDSEPPGESAAKTSEQSLEEILGDAAGRPLPADGPWLAEPRTGDQD